MKEVKVAKEQAELEFDNFCVNFDIDTDCRDQEEQESFNDIKDVVVKAIMYGHLTFNENSEPIYVPHRSDCKPLTFREMDGASFMAGDKSQGNHQAMHAILADLTKTTSGTFAKMKNADLKVCRAILRLFMA
tara:strand:- start:5947 stop:6342 length:396 start_codon:yes stop_codon:yes gene_type:complete